MRLKNSSVDPKGITPELFLALLEADRLYKKAGAKEVVITSMNDSKHMKGSKHYCGNAADLRIWNVRSPEKVCRTLGVSLGDDYDVILEHNHIHLEYDPK